MDHTTLGYKTRENTYLCPRCFPMTRARRDELTEDVNDATALTDAWCHVCGQLIVDDAVLCAELHWADVCTEYDKLRHDYLTGRQVMREEVEAYRSGKLTRAAEYLRKARKAA